MAGTVRTRRDVWKLAAWDPILLWYANAILEMQKRPIDDPTSWRYQAAIHKYERAFDPHAKDTDRLPSPADQQRFWSRCQHFSWYFLPWHRIYLAYFEQIVASIVADLGGPADWALPYWNYSDAANPNARRLPPAFRQEKLPDGRDNPLRVKDRSSASNGNADMAIDIQVDIRKCLDEPFFIGTANGGAAGFGGPRTGFNHDSGDVVGWLEAVPHGSMHMAVGGWMRGFHTAGLDPIFWLHHCNIDRLWSVWRNRNPQHLDPTDNQWLMALKFKFHDVAGNVVDRTPAEVVDTTTTPPLGYRYEDISDPFPDTLDAAPEGLRRIAMDQDAIPEMVGATEEPVTLTGRPTSAHLSVSEPIGPAVRAAGDVDAPPSRVYLNVENITGSGVPASYAVYLNVPPGEDPAEHRERYAGLLPMFGVAEASREDSEHPGSGLHYVLEVGEVVRTLEAQGAWNPDDLEVAFIPIGVEAEGVRATEAVEPDAIQVGQISLYYA